MTTQDPRLQTNLVWLRPELDKVLAQARQALEDFVEEEDLERMPECVRHLHQVHGILHVAQVNGATMLAEELEKVAEAIASEQVDNAEEVAETLMLGLVQLPAYLEHLAKGKADQPLALLPVLNDLRAARKASLMSEMAVFAPHIEDLIASEPVAPGEGNPEFANLVKQQRPLFHRGLLRWFKGQDPATGLQRITEVFTKLEDSAETARVSRVFAALEALSIGLQEESLDPTVAVKRLFSGIDRFFRALIEQGEAATASDFPLDLYKNTLFYVAQCDTQHATIKAVQKSADLENSVPATGNLDFGSPDVAMLSAVSQALGEDLLSIKDKLDLYIRSDRGETQRLIDLAQPLQKLADTLGMVGRGDLRGQLRESCDWLNSLSAEDRPEEDPLMRLAENVLLVESSLQGLQVDEQQSGPGTGISRISTGELGGHLKVVVQEALIELNKVKDGISNYLQYPDTSDALTAVPGHLHAVAGALRIVDQSQPGSLLDALSRYIGELEKGERDIPDSREREYIADLVTSIEYFLEAIGDNRADRYELLDYAQTAADNLGLEIVVPPAPPTPLEDLAQIEVVQESTAESSFAESVELPPIVDESTGDAPLAEVAAEESGQEEALAPGEPEPEPEVTDEAMVEAAPEAEPAPPPPPPAAEKPPLEDIDPEILEIFIEEAREELEVIGEQLPIWRERHTDEHALTTIRRSFHTLKGSGRLVGAKTIGEYAWSVENLLNRVIDNTVDLDDDIFGVIETARQVLPELIDAQENGRAPNVDVASLEAYAFALADPSQPRPAVPPSGEPAPAEVADDESAQADQASADEPQTAPALSPLPNVDDIFQIEEEDEDFDLAGALSEEIVDLDALEAPFGEEDEAVDIDLADLSPALPAETAEPSDTGAIDLDLEQDDAASVDIDNTGITLTGLAIDNQAVDLEFDEAEAETPPAPQMQLDDVLLDIFRNESNEHLGTIKAFLDDNRELVLGSLLSEELRRAFHTLKGSSHTAGVTPMAEVAGSLEKYVNALRERGMRSDQTILALLERGYTALMQMLAAINVAAAELPDWQALADQVVATRLSLEADQPINDGDESEESDEGLDPEMVEIFLEEARELVDNMEDSFTEWAADPVEPGPIQAMQRNLHTLKGGARLAGITALGDLSHAMESTFEALAEQRIAPSSDLLTTLRQAADQVASNVDLLQMGERLPRVPELVSRLEAMARGKEVSETPPHAPRTEPDEDELGEPGAPPVELAPEKTPQADGEAVDSNQPDLVLAGDEAESTLIDGWSHDAIAEIDESDIELAELDPTLSGDFELELDSSIAPTSDEPPQLEPTDLDTQAPEAAEPAPALDESTAADEQAQELDDLDLVLQEALDDDGATAEAIAMPSDDSAESAATELDQADLGDIDLALDDQELLPESTPTPEISAAELEIPAEGVLEASEVEPPADAEPIDEPETQAASETDEPGEHEEIAAAEVANIDLALEVEDDIAEAQREPEIVEAEDLAAQEISDSETENLPDDQSGPLAETEGFEEADLAASGEIDLPLSEEDSASPDLGNPAEPAEATSPEPAETSPQSEAEEETVDGESIDPELMEIFLEEAKELVDEMESAFGEWSGDLNANEPIKALQRDLHTLKGGARLVKMSSLGELSHAMESLFEAINEHRIQPNNEIYQLARSAADHVAGDVDTLVAGSYPGPAPDLITQLEAAAHDQPFVVADSHFGSPADTEQAELPDEAPTHDSSEPASEDNTESLLAIGDSLFSDSQLMTDSELLSEPQFESDSFEVSQDSEIAGEHSDIASSFLADQSREAQVIQFPRPAGEAATEDEKPDEGRPAPHVGQERVRVAAEALDQMVNNAGEISIYRARLEQQNTTMEFNLNELDQTVIRLREQLRKLELETEAQILSRHEREREEAEETQQDDDFDPLEMDRYSNIQQLSRALVETINDLDNINESLAELRRDTDTLLLQQARVTNDLQDGLMRTRMIPFSTRGPRLQRLVRQTAHGLGKLAELDIHGAEGEMDRGILDRMMGPLEHLLRNAVAHGIESPEQRRQGDKHTTGRISLDLSREGADILLTVSDDGAGLDRDRIREKAIDRGLMDPKAKLADDDIYQFVLAPGFSTATTVSQVSGRGVGLDVVVSEVKQLGGTLEIDSQPGRGCSFNIRLPFTLAISDALLVTAGEDVYAIPHTSIDGVVRMSRTDLEDCYAGRKENIEYSGRAYQVRYLGRLLGAKDVPMPEQQRWFPMLLVRSGDHRIAVQVDGLIGNRQIVVKSVGSQLSSVPWITGGTILADGRVSLILDMNALIRLEGAHVPVVETIETEEDFGVTVMVVDDSITVRKVTSRLLERHNMNVLTAKDGVDAVAQLQEHHPDVLLLDIEMPRMDGFELARHMRNSADLANIPIIMITSRTGDKHRNKAMELGVSRYLGKPYQEADLLDNIYTVLAEKSA